MIIMIFMAVTSSGASEMLAVSSLFTFDVYRRYLKPKARPRACKCMCLAMQRQLPKFTSNLMFSSLALVPTSLSYCGQGWRSVSGQLIRLCTALSLPLVPVSTHARCLPACAYVCLEVPDMPGCMQADGPHLVMVSRIAVAVWAVIMGIAMCIAQVANININWLILLIGASSLSFSLRMHYP